LLFLVIHYFLTVHYFRYSVRFNNNTKANYIDHVKSDYHSQNYYTVDHFYHYYHSQTDHNYDDYSTT